MAMAQKVALFPDLFLQAPEFNDPDKTLLSRQIFLIVRAFVVSAVILQLALIVLDPRITLRWLALLLATVTVSGILLWLNRCGRVLAAAWLLVVSLWLLIGIFSWTRAGLGTRAAYGYFIVVFIAGMVLGKWQGIGTAAICSASTLLIALQAPFRSSDPYRFWLVNTLYLVVVLLMQNLAGRFIRESLDRAQAELRERQKSEEALRARNQFVSSLMRALPLAVFFKDKQGRYTGCNDVFSEIMGVTSEEIIGKTVHELWPSQLAETYHRKDLELMRDREHQVYEFQVKDRFGEPRPVIFAKDVILGSDGEVEGLVGAFLDISDRKQAEMALQENERRYRAVFESVGDAVLLTREKELVDCNAKALELFGCRREDLAVLTAGFFAPEEQPDGRDSREKAMEKIGAALGGQITRFDWVHVRKDGTSFPAEVTLNRLELSSGLHLLAVIRDVSERRKLEEQLLQAQKMEAIGNLAGGVAHDFNNILSAIVGYGSLLQMKVERGGPLSEYVERILAAGERAANLTSSLLAFSRKQEAELLPIDINDAIYGFHKILARLIGEDIDFSLNLASESLVIDADARQFEQVLMNLVNNSRDAMPRGGRLTISTSAVVFDSDSGDIPAGAYAAIAVSDSGTGIGKEVRAHIFEPFFTTKDVGKGTGLGLAIVYGIVKKHQGHIRVESFAEGGATFTIYLPLKSAARSGQKRRKPAAIPKGSETILLIEDDPAVRQVTRSMLEEFGYTVLEADDGVSAQYVFREHSRRIDLVVCDLLMPRLNGRETLAGLRKVKPGIPAIFISGYASDVIARKGLADSGAQLLMKPLNPGTLLRQVRALLDRRRAAPGRDAEATAVPAGDLTKKQSRR